MKGNLAGRLGPIGLAWWLLSGASAQAGNTDPTHPNVIILYYDDFGYSDFGANDDGQESLTPRLDTLAAQGMTFTAGHSASGVCTPSRYAIMTGRYPWRTSRKSGVTGGYSEPEVAEDRFTIGELFQQNGYHTSMVGKWHVGMQFYDPLGSPVDLANNNNVLGADPTTVSDDLIDFSIPLTRTPTANGFDYFFGTSASLDMPPYAWIENETVLFQGGIVTSSGVDFSQARPATNADFLEGQPVSAVNRVRDGVYDPTFVVSDYLEVQAAKVTEIIDARAVDGQPFFIYVPFPSPHKPWSVSSQFAGTTPYAYGDYLAQSDHYAGVILEALDRSGMADNTVVFMSSDNGPELSAQDASVGKSRDSNGPFRGVKRDTWEGGTRVPFVIRWPGHVRAGTRSNQAVSQVDFLATMAEFLGFPLQSDEAPDSESFLPVLEGYDMPSQRREGFIRHSFRGQFAIVDRDGIWKLIDGTGSGGGRSNSYDADDQKISNAAGVVRGTPRQLFDLATDPEENTNLLVSPSADALLKESALYTLLNDIRGDTTLGVDGDSDVPPNDLDGDGISNFFEEAYPALDASDPADAILDPDGDGLSNLEEFASRTDPENPDTDGDGVSDGTEVAQGTKPNGASVLALFSAGPAVSGSVLSPTNPAFASVDGEAATSATSLRPGSGLTGGGANSFVIDRSTLQNSASGAPAYNFGGVTTAERDAAKAAGDFVVFDHLTGGETVWYDTLSFTTNQHGAGARLDVSYTIGGQETFVLEGYVPNGSGASLSKVNIDLRSVVTAQDVTWTFYLYGATNPNFGTRLDDITLEGSVVEVLAHYNAESGTDGNFDTIAFDSVDAESVTVASRLSQGGGLTGGGASQFVLTRNAMNTSVSGAPAFNLASGTTADADAAKAAGDTMSFTVDGNGARAAYEGLSFYTNQFGTGGRISVSRTVDGVETFVLDDVVPIEADGDLAFVGVNFRDFATTLPVTWTFHFYGASRPIDGTRLDDIRLYGRLP